MHQCVTRVSSRTFLSVDVSKPGCTILQQALAHITEESASLLHHIREIHGLLPVDLGIEVNLVVSPLQICTSRACQTARYSLRLWDDSL